MDYFWIKLIVSPMLVVLADAWFPEVNYASLYHAIGVGFVLALAGQWLDRMMLVPGRLWMTTALDLIIGFLVVSLSLFVLPTAQVTFLGAGFVAIFFGLAEYVQHRWIIHTNRRKAA